MSALLSAVVSLLLVAGPVGAKTGAVPPPTQIQYGEGRGLVLAGTVLVVTAVAAYGVMGAGLALGRNSEDRLATLLGADDIARRRETLRHGRAGNIMATAGGISALTFMITGIWLISAGRRRAGTVAMMPARRGAGVTWSLAF